MQWPPLFERLWPNTIPKGEECLLGKLLKFENSLPKPMKDNASSWNYMCIMWVGYLQVFKYIYIQFWLHIFSSLVPLLSVFSLFIYLFNI